MLFFMLGYLTLLLVYGTVETSQIYIVDSIALGCFAFLNLEIVVRMVTHGLKYYFYQPNNYYLEFANRFDLVVTVIPAIVMVVFALSPIRTAAVNTMWAHAKTFTLDGGGASYKPVNMTLWSIPGLFHSWVTEDFISDDQGRRIAVPEQLNNDPLRVLLALPLLRLFSNIESMRTLFFGMLLILPGFIGIFGLLMVFVFLYATLMVWVVSTNLVIHTETGNINTFTLVEGMDEDAKQGNFNSLYDGLMTSFQLFVGEAWDGVMETSATVKYTIMPWVVMLFMLYVILITLLFSNLFVGVIIDAFSILSDLNEDAEGPISKHDFYCALTEADSTRNRFIKVSLPDNKCKSVVIRRIGIGARKHGRKGAKEMLWKVVLNVLPEKMRQDMLSIRIQRTFRKVMRMHKLEARMELAGVNAMSDKNQGTVGLTLNSLDDNAGIMVSKSERVRKDKETAMRLKAEPWRGQVRESMLSNAGLTAS